VPECRSSDGSLRVLERGGMSLVWRSMNYMVLVGPYVQNDLKIFLERRKQQILTEKVKRGFQPTCGTGHDV
jgi:hypothetical protein